nr:hypothetical protein BaRGS_032563 [Batillaria attramentaria]
MMMAIPVTFLVLCFVTPSLAYSSFKGRLPNGDHVPHPCKPNYLWHGWSSTLCRLDSDGDGLTNGQELGDPDCVWTPGQIPARTTGITHPGVCDPFDSDTCRERNSWVSCETGEFVCDGINEPDVKNITLRYPITSVPNTETNYFCMTVDLPSDAPYHIVGVKPFIDNAEVMHHILLYGCDNPDEAPLQDAPQPCGMGNTGGCMSIIGGWTVGSPGQCVKGEAGFLIGTGGFRRARLQFHWNNPELRSDYTDSSGLTLFYTPKLRSYNTATFVVGQRIFEIPPAQPSVVISGSCTPSCSRRIISRPAYVTTVQNHMHYLGRSQKVEVFRNGNLVTTLANDERYSYDSPVRHELGDPFQLMPGDEIRTTCEFASTYNTRTVFYGDGTFDEMCYSFLAVYPAEALPYAKMCVGARSYSTCDMFSGRYGQCDLRKFTNVSHPETKEMMEQIYDNCNAFGSCRPECHALMTEMIDHPCLQGDAYEFLREAMTKTHKGTIIMAMLESCRHQLRAGEQQCPRCQQCDGHTGTATLAAPEVISMATLSMFTILMRYL